MPRCRQVISGAGPGPLQKMIGAFGSKDELVRACLRARHDAARERMRREPGARYPHGSGSGPAPRAQLI
ncbi:MAG: hypothetical protein QOG05_4780 [Streptosporangiaceae bacterium]|jgi:hypothetical protein|nr:hypothetical protein [Streptosporangiaceae bacterium]